MKKKVSDLEGAELDLWVANAASMKGADCGPSRFNPSGRWEHGGPIIERERIATWPDGDGWTASGPNAIFGYDGPEGKAMNSGPTLLIAAMRCFVASKFGDEVEPLAIPKTEA